MKIANITKIALACILSSSALLLAQPKGWVPGDKPRGGKPERHGQGFDKFSEGDYREPKHGPGPKPGPGPGPGPKPGPGPAPHPGPGPGPKPDPHPGYRPGFHSHKLMPPREREFYREWRFLRAQEFYHFSLLPDTLQVGMRNFTSTSFKLEENATTGYTWFARYDPEICTVTIDHKGPARFGMLGEPGHAKIVVSARRPGDTMVEFIYARRWEWEKGVEPDKVIQLFVHVDP